jgi:histidinol dehydrogenase
MKYQLINYPAPSEWKTIMARPTADASTLYDTVNAILADIRANGDKAVLEYARKFDHVSLTTLKVSEEEIQEASRLVPEELKQAIALAKRNIETFHIAQQHTIRKIETMPGVTCWQKTLPIEKAGLYIPGGTAPLFSTVLMLAVPAKIAGCKDIILCSPPAENGKIHPAILYAASESGVTSLFKVGGAQAIGAMAYGTETIPQVYKIFGPGNQYVTAAKQLVGMNSVAIDMPAGPSEVLVIADKTANPAFVAADLLSQAEHGRDSQALLLTTDEQLAANVMLQLETQLPTLPRKEFAEQSLEHSKIIVLRTMKEIIDFSNLYAPEHLIIETADFTETAEKITSAGSVFLGHYTPESAGDYASGTNHTLPTNGHARAFSGVNLDSFMKKITFQEISRQGIAAIGPSIELMAEAEQLTAHKNAVTLRRLN